jgi:peptide/nickel transport system ATP-binding protein
VSQAQAIPATDELLVISGLRVSYELGGRTGAAVDGVDLVLRRGDSLGLAGESGCGKSTLALACMGLLPKNATTEGSILFDGHEVVGAKPGRLRAIRWAGIAMVFQGAMNALNPVKRIEDQIAEALILHGERSAASARATASELMGLVGIPARRVRDYPHEFSGGMRQRVMMAMALACNPPLVIADEPTTALDVMIQAQILELLDRLRKEMGLTLIVITHDLSVLAQVAERVAIMYAGRIVEHGYSHEVLTRPAHPYSKALVAAFPRVGDAASRRIPMGLPGDPPDPAARPPGCSFHPRCPQRFEPCDHIDPGQTFINPEWSAACHAVELEVKGARR